jgi:hypothetical protein
VGEPVAPTLDSGGLDDAGLGELAGQYELRAELGRGGSAVVYQARDRRLGREVALKAIRLAPALGARERALEVARLAREARTTARLDHPHIVTVFAVHELRDGLAVAMQFVPGRSLKQLLAAEGALDPAHAVRLLGEVAGALAYAHAHGVVHRDVKPENIFVDAASGRALLADFGAARSGDVDVRVTRTGVTVGTPAYMSPEQIDGGPVDGRADLYALGLVAWEALTGRRPWEGRGCTRRCTTRSTTCCRRSPRCGPADRPAVPPALEYVVARLLEKRPGGPMGQRRGAGVAARTPGAAGGLQAVGAGAPASAGGVRGSRHAYGRGPAGSTGTDGPDRAVPAARSGRWPGDDGDHARGRTSRRWCRRRRGRWHAQHGGGARRRAELGATGCPPGAPALAGGRGRGGDPARRGAARLAPAGRPRDDAAGAAGAGRGPGGGLGAGGTRGARAGDGRGEPGLRGCRGRSSDCRRRTSGPAGCPDARCAAARRYRLGR